jgi:ATP:ADP antiporter, AAA family
MVSRLEWFFNLRPGDLRRGILLTLYYFLIISTYTEGQVVRDALFLGHFKAVQLPYVDFAVAAIIGGILALYIRLGRRTSLINLLAGTLSLCFVNVVGFWWMANLGETTWLYPVVYIWVGMFGALAITQVWTLANYILTGREAKRLFGFIGSGGILGGIFGGFISTALAHMLGAESMLLAMAASLGICVALVFAIRAQNGEMHHVLTSPSAIDEASPGTLRESFRLVRSSPHLLTIAALICVCSIVTGLASWQFRAIAKHTLINKDAMAAFFGWFYAYTGIVALAIQLLLTPRILRHFGIRIALLVLPVAYVMGTTMLIAFAALWAATLVKGSDRIIRYSIDTAAVQLLYLPIPPGTKIQVKTFLDTVVLRAGDGLAAVLVLLLVGGLGLTASQVGWISLALLLLWIIVARRAGRQYVHALGESLKQQILDTESLNEPEFDRSATQMFLKELRSNEPSKIVYALGLLETARWDVPYSAIRKLLGHPVPEVRAKTVLVLRNMGDLSVVSRMEQLLQDTDFGVRTEALLFLAQHTNVDPLTRIQNLRDFEDFSIQASTVAFLARSENGRNLDAARLIVESMVKDHGPTGERTRIESARLIRLLPANFASYLFQLLQDDNPAVLREAVRTTRVYRKREFIPLLIRLLGNPELREVTSEALFCMGENIQGSLRDHLSDPNVSVQVKREIPELLVIVAGRDAHHALTANLIQTDNVLRFRIIAALNKLHELYPDIEIDAQTIEAVLASEIMSHYRSYQVMATMGGQIAHESFSTPLQKSIDNELERIFRLLKMLHPDADFESAFVGLQSHIKTEHDTALEFIENILKPGVRQLLIPLVDAEIALAEKVELANRILGSRVESKDDALRVLIYTQDSWMKSCAAHLIGVLGLVDYQKELEEWASDPDPLLQDKARRAQQRLAVCAFSAPEKLAEVSCGPAYHEQRTKR